MKLRYLKDEHIEVPEPIVTILNDVFMEGGLAYRSGGWHKKWRGYVGSHSDWEHTIATAYMKLSQQSAKSRKPRAASKNATTEATQERKEALDE